MHRAVLPLLLVAVLVVAAAGFTVGLLLPEEVEATQCFQVYNYYTSKSYKTLVGQSGEGCCGPIDWGVQTSYYLCLPAACPDETCEVPEPPDGNPES